MNVPGCGFDIAIGAYANPAYVQHPSHMGSREVDTQTADHKNGLVSCQWGCLWNKTMLLTTYPCRCFLAG